MLTRTYINGQKREAADGPPPLVREEQEEKLGLQIQELAENHERQMESLQAEVARLSAASAELKATAQPEFVISRNGAGGTHRALPGYWLEPPDMWRTWCGWKYGGYGKRASDTSHLPIVRRCEHCFRGEVN